MIKDKDKKVLEVVCKTGISVDEAIKVLDDLEKQIKEKRHGVLFR